MVPALLAARLLRAAALVQAVVGEVWAIAALRQTPLQYSARTEEAADQIDVCACRAREAGKEEGAWHRKRGVQNLLQGRVLRTAHAFQRQQCWKLDCETSVASALVVNPVRPK